MTGAREYTPLQFARFNGFDTVAALVRALSGWMAKQPGPLLPLSPLMGAALEAAP